MKADDLEAAHETAKQSSHDIDREFQQFLSEIVDKDQPKKRSTLSTLFKIQIARSSPQ
jgi:hypothetical protein